MPATVVRGVETLAPVRWQKTGESVWLNQMELPNCAEPKVGTEICPAFTTPE